MPAQSQIDRDSFRATATGFTSTCHGQLQTFNDDDVRAVGIRRQRTVGFDGTARTREWLSVRVADATFPTIEVDSVYTGPDDNFLAAFRDRLLVNLSDRAILSLSLTAQYDGGPWAIHDGMLVDRHSSASIPLEAISGIAWRDGRFCLWRDGSDQPAMSFGAEEENTYLLARLLSRLLQIEDGQWNTPDVTPGRSAYEFRDTGIMAEIAIGVAVIAFLIVRSHWVLAGNWKGMIPLGMAAIVVAALAYRKVSRPHILRLADNALSIVARGCEVVLPLWNLAEFRADWTDDRDIYHGVRRTRVRFQFRSDDPSVRPMEYHSRAIPGRPKHKELQAFQSTLASYVAQRLREDLETHGRAHWTPHLTILQSGIEFTKKPGREGQQIDFSQIKNWRLKRGLFKLTLDGRWLPTVVEHINEWNFYPGLALFTEMLESHRSSSMVPVEALAD